MKREDRLIRVDRELGLHVAVADRVAVTIEVLLDRLVKLEARERQALAVAERHPELGARVTRQVEAGGQRRQSQRGAVVVPELDDPRVPSHSRREAQLERKAGE